MGDYREVTGYLGRDCGTAAMTTKTTAQVNSNATTRKTICKPYTIKALLPYAVCAWKWGVARNHVHVYTFIFNALHGYCSACSIYRFYFLVVYTVVVMLLSELFLGALL